MQAISSQIPRIYSVLGVALCLAACGTDLESPTASGGQNTGGVTNADGNYAPVIQSVAAAPGFAASSCAPVTLTVTAEDLDGDAVIYYWRPPQRTVSAMVNFRADGAQFTATFSQPGSFPIEVKACDRNGACDTMETGIFVTPSSELCASVPLSTKWRIRNASSSRANAWALRGLELCHDVACEYVGEGTVIHDGSAPFWGAADSIFDDDFTNFWKSFRGPLIGEAWIGLEFDMPQTISALKLRPDNIVYGVKDIWVEYFDAVANEWVTYALLTDVPRHYGELMRGGPSYSNSDVWYYSALREVVPLDL